MVRSPTRRHTPQRQSGGRAPSWEGMATSVILMLVLFQAGAPKAAISKSLKPISLEETWMGYQFHRADLDKGFALVFKRFDSPHVIYSVNDTFTFKLRGIDPQSRYQLHYEQSNKDEALTGQALAKGIEIVVGKAPGAELVVYEPAR